MKATAQSSIKLGVEVTQTETSTVCLQIIFQYYKARALAWACRSVAVSVWEPCMAIERALRPRWGDKKKEKQEFRVKTQMLNSEPIKLDTLVTGFLKNTYF